MLCCSVSQRCMHHHHHHHHITIIHSHWQNQIWWQLLNEQQQSEWKKITTRTYRKKIDLSGIDFHFSLLFFRLSLSFFSLSSSIFFFVFNLYQYWYGMETMWIAVYTWSCACETYQCNIYTKLKLIFAIECSVVIFFFRPFGLSAHCHRVMLYYSKCCLIFSFCTCLLLFGCFTLAFYIHHSQYCFFFFF